MSSLYQVGQKVALRKSQLVSGSGGVFEIEAGALGTVQIVVDFSYHVRFEIAPHFFVMLYVPEVGLCPCLQKPECEKPHNHFPSVP